MDMQSHAPADLGERLFCLIELGYDATAAYSAAIQRLESPDLKLLFEGFRTDHVRHTVNLCREMRALGATPPTGLEVPSVLTHGASFIQELKQDEGVLVAMRLNEGTTFRAYAQALLHPRLPNSLAVVLRQNLDDEYRHGSWIQFELEKRREAKLKKTSSRPPASKGMQGQGRGSRFDS